MYCSETAAFLLRVRGLVSCRYRNLNLTSMIFSKYQAKGGGGEGATGEYPLLWISAPTTFLARPFSHNIIFKLSSEDSSVILH